MAKRRRKGKEGSTSGYFRQLFAENPEWIHETSNDIILARYRQDKDLAPDAPLEKNIRQSLANVKSDIRKREREGDGEQGGRGRRGAAIPVARAVLESPPGNEGLELLEEM